MDFVRGFISFIGGIFLAIGVVNLLKPILPTSGVAPMFVALVIYVGSIGLVYLIIDGLFGNHDKTKNQSKNKASEVRDIKIQSDNAVAKTISRGITAEKTKKTLPIKPTPKVSNNKESKVTTKKPKSKVLKATRAEIEEELNNRNKVEKHKRVGYDKSIDSYIDYPKILVPEHLCIVRTHNFIRDKKKIKRRGFTEEKFENLLRKELPAKVKIYGNLSISTSNKAFAYEPDIGLIVNSWRNIRIDIEIDEPYNGYTRELTHISRNDTRRDDYFNRRGWVLLRFTEKQVHNHPHVCMNIIKAVLTKLDDYNFKFINDKITDLKESILEEQWNGEKAREWELNKYRESYLNHEFGIVDSDPIKQFKDLTTQELSEESLVNKESDGKIAVAHFFEEEPIDFIELEQNNSFEALDTQEVSGMPHSSPNNKEDLKKILNSDYYDIQNLISIAVEKKYSVQMTYTNYDLITSERKVDNLQYTEEFIIDGYEYKEHFKGYCLLRNEERSFKISRIDYLKVLTDNT